MSYGLPILVLGSALVAFAGAASAQSQQPPSKGAPLPQTQPQAPQAATAQDRIAAALQRVQGACGEELKNYCSAVTPGEGRLLQCMQAHQDKLGNQCELALYDASRNIAQAMNRVERIAEACWNDIQAHCSAGGSVARCVIDKRDSLSPACQAAVSGVQPSAAQQQPLQQTNLAGRPIYSADGVRLGQVTDVKLAPDGAIQMIQADLGGMLGFGTTSVLITPDEFDQQADRLQLRIGADQVWSAIQGQKK